MCPWRPFARTGAHWFSFGATAWRVAEPMAKSPREMGVVAKAAGIRDLAERLACLQRRASMQKARGVIQPCEIYEMRAGGIARGKELLEIAQRNSRLGSDLARRDARIGKAVLYDAADAHEQLFVVA